MKFEKNDYVLRIANATPSKLVSLACELTLEYLNLAKNALEDDDEKKFRSNLEITQSILQQISASLNMEYPISWELLSLYLYTNKLLAQAGASSEVIHLEHAEKILKNMLEAWQGVEELHQDDQAPVLENAEQVYSGLTYGRGGLDEFVVQDNNRGFKA